ncbi:asparagine synthetase [glutamine-hydrolyzing] isoform X2 [Zootermopsis nevadensis]|uniref:asparagine synthetase [glutamine-hydrolyzing] isoform X2 n=1 Tax=Zootermopsis nevadensis TaxID=136037 RepID=UPI000B8EBE3E|nr:asparagine synthetase [glutamine-hydrolyzing] isoform X2 [Zootermopsis nevadensis]
MLKEEYGFKYETNCDVECILHLYATGGIEHCAQSLDGVFVFCIVDSAKQHLYLGRDPYGVRPLFRLLSKTGILGICSEAKGLIDLEHEVNGEIPNLEPFPPGCVEDYEINETGRTTFVMKKAFYSIGNKPYFKPLIPYESLSINDVHANIRTLLTAAVRKRLMADRRIGCLLSGGLDSSLVAALLVKLAKDENLPYKIQSFAVGMGNSPDIEAARVVANHIGTEHHEVIFTEQDVMSVLDKVIYHLETPDITTVRASIGMYLISRYIKQNTDTTVVFSGEGADEVAQGYIYFRDAPSADAAHSDSLRLLKDIYLFDGLRADRTTAAHGLELRVPFLDLQFTNYYLGLPAATRQPQGGVEKHLLRSAFDSTDLLPKSILWRHKEAFSDGVASAKKSLFQVIQELVDSRLGNDTLEKASEKFPHCTPTTKESFYYREVFEKNFPKQSHFLPYFWMPQWTDVKDPSARFISHYAADKQQLGGM